MTQRPTDIDPLIELRDWSIAAVASYVHDDRESQAIILSEPPPMALEALAMLCASQMQVLAELEGRSVEASLQNLALILQRQPLE